MPIRHVSYASVSAVALTAATAEVFAKLNVPLQTSAEFAVVAGFWLMVSAGGLWLWKRFGRRRGQGKE